MVVDLGVSDEGRGNLLCSPYAIDTRNNWVLCSEETEIFAPSTLHFPNYSHRSPSSGKIGKQLLSTTELVQNLD